MNPRTLLARLFLRAARATQAFHLRMQRIVWKDECVLGKDVHLLDGASIHRHFGTREAIRIGSNSRVRGSLSVFSAQASISIGEWCYLGNDSYVWAGVSITIGDRVLISHGVNIHDFISPSLSASERHAQAVEIFTHGHPEELSNVPSAPIVIEDDVWLGFNVTVLKGVRIGKGAVVGANTVVTKDVEPYSVVVGSPLRVVGTAPK